MMRSEYAGELWTLLEKCEACLTHKIYEKSNLPDFSHFDKQPAENDDITITDKSSDDSNILPQNARTNTKPDMPIINPAKSVSNKSTPERRQLIDLATEISACQKCSLSSAAKIKTPGQGAIPSDIMIISFYTDDAAEKTMFPMAGNILDQFNKWLSAIKININDVYITNLIKCNPHNQSINKNFIENCLFYLDSEIKIIRPKIIMTLGSTVVSSLCHKFVDINAYHGQILNYRGFQVFPTYHPTDVLSNPFLRKPVWDDLQKFKAIYERMLSDPGYTFE